MTPQHSFDRYMMQLQAPSLLERIKTMQDTRSELAWQWLHVRSAFIDELLALYDAEIARLTQQEQEAK